MNKQKVENTTTTTRSMETAEEVATLLRARNPLLWVVTREEARVERCLIEAAAAAGYMARTWDVAQGVREVSGQTVRGFGDPDPKETLAVIDAKSKADLDSARPERCVWILRDLPVWLSGAMGASVMRQLRNLARSLPATKRENAQALIVLTPSSEIPPELTGHATVIEWPLPDRAEIAAILDATIDMLPEKEPAQRELKAKVIASLRDGAKDAAIDGAVGMSGIEVASTYARSLVGLQRIDPLMVQTEKKRIVGRDKVLELCDSLPGGLEAVGGLHNLKPYLVSRRAAFTPEARAYGLPAPKAILLVGVSGCGKSRTAKAVATAWGVPLVRFDGGALKSKYVGESEGLVRKAYATINALGRCVVWFDEIEKMFQGATSGSADGGVATDQLGSFLTWSEERKGEAFIIATCNDVEGLPPELLGRFEVMWFVDLPAHEERMEIVAAALRDYNRNGDNVDLDEVAAACDQFTGREISALMRDALYTAFADGMREVRTSDLVDGASQVVPLSKTAAEKIGRLRAWATGRTRPASAFATKATVAPQATVARVDLDFAR